MASNNISRLFLSKAPSPTISHARSSLLTLSVSKSVSRLICLPTQQSSPLEENSEKTRAEATEKDHGGKGKEGHPEDEKDDEGGVFVNKATGEVGGPRGPEPTRYGDWERNGRCSDF